MKKIIGISVFFFAIFFFINSVYAADCNYKVYSCREYGSGYIHDINLDYSLAPYCSKYSDYTLKLSGKSGSIYIGEEKEGKHGALGGDEDLNDWTESSCPDYISVNSEAMGLSYSWSGHDSLSSAETKVKAASDATDSVIFIRDSLLEELKEDAKDFDMTVSKTCTYTKKIQETERTFAIDFNKDGYAISAKSTEETSFYINSYYHYTISSSMRKIPQQVPGVCENVYVELENTEREWVDPNPDDMIPPRVDYYYIIYNDSGDCVDQGGDCDDTDGSVSSDEGNNATCKTYETRFKEYSTNYASCVDGNENAQCEVSTNIEIKLNVSCQNIFKKQTYGDECLKFCLELDRKIATVKQTSAKDYNQSQCGFSARVVNWIMKIIKWIRYIVPALLIALSVMDFIKAIASDSEDEVRKVGAKFVKRLIVAALIFALPLLLEFLLGIFNIPVKDFCV